GSAARWRRRPSATGARWNATSSMSASMARICRRSRAGAGAAPGDSPGDRRHELTRAARGMRPVGLAGLPGEEPAGGASASDRRVVYLCRCGCCGGNAMSEEKTVLKGPDLTQGIEFSRIADGTMLLGHARGEPVLLARRGDELFAI